MNKNTMTLRNQTQHQLYHDQHLYVDLRYELVILDGHTLTLTRKEYCLLVLLVQHAEEAMSRETRCGSGVIYSRRGHARSILTFVGCGENWGYPENNTSRQLPVLDIVSGPGRGPGCLM